MAGVPFREPIFPYGPFVMNTQEEIRQRLADLRNGTFVQSEAERMRSSKGHAAVSGRSPGIPPLSDRLGVIGWARNAAPSPNPHRPLESPHPIRPPVQNAPGMSGAFGF